MSIEELLKENSDEVSLKVTSQEIKVGSIYPVYGMITAINVSGKSEEAVPQKVTVELNKNILIDLKVQSQEKIDLLKERMLECAIFVAKVQSVEPMLLECQTVIFGKKQVANN